MGGENLDNWRWRATVKRTLFSRCPPEDLEVIENHFWERLQNCEKRLLALSPVCLSVRPHGTTRLPLDGYS